MATACEFYDKAKLPADVATLQKTYPEAKIVTLAPSVVSAISKKFDGMLPPEGTTEMATVEIPEGGVVFIFEFDKDGCTVRNPEGMSLEEWHSFLQQVVTEATN